MDLQQEIAAATEAARTEELTIALQSVVESFEPYRADHRPDHADFDRWLIWNDRTSERLGIVGLHGPQERSLSLLEMKVLLRSRAMDLLRKVA
jgi:hypothetical protein